MQNANSIINKQRNENKTSFPAPPLGSREAELFFLLHHADNALLLAQRNSEWCGHGSVLEQDIAITNISLDLLGQATNFYQYGCTINS